MQDIISTTEKVTSVIEEIASASQEQRSGIAQINDAVTLMDEVTQRNAALVEEAAAAAGSLENQTFALMNALSIFKL
jgi:methyl-accepting chemotaxis protein